MQPSADQSRKNPPTVVRPDSHYQHLQQVIPQWLGNTSSTRREALKNTQPDLHPALKTATEAQHQALVALNAEHWTAQDDVDQQLEHFRDASAFAEPLLKEALKSRFGLELDVKSTFLRLYVPLSTALFPIKTGARAWTVSLLDAALHNFDKDESADTAYEADSTFITAPSTTGQFDTLPALKKTVPIPTFIKMCRELDIGGQYKTYLEDHLGISDASTAKTLRDKIDASQKAALKAALQMARLKRDIRETSFLLINGLLDGLQGMRVDGEALACHDLTMMSASLTGIVIFAPNPESARKTVRVVAYVPDDPEHPIKEYASTAEMAVELTRQLRSNDYQRFFSRFVNHDQRGFFFANLNERLSKIKWHPPVAGDSRPPWREAPADNPNLQFAVSPIAGDLWRHLYQTKLNKILNDAAVQAVPTAAVDRATRWAVWDSLVKIASTILETAAFVIAPFVPVLGEAMMAYMAYQMLDQTFEGIVEWAQGRTTEAFEHLMGTVESMIQLGMFAVGGAIVAGEFRKVLPAEVVAFIDRYKPVQLANGQTRYWDPELSRYQQEGAPPEHSRPDDKGLHQHEGKQLLPLEDAHFAVSEGAHPGDYQIDHPTRADAYKPQLRHNGDGAWHTELERPLEWDKPTLLRRIGHAVESFSPAQRETILKVSGYNEGALRRMHVNQESLPPLLADSIKRFKIDQQLQQFAERLNSDVPAEYLRADPLTQLQILAEHGRWPSRKNLRFVGNEGEINWQSSVDQSLPVTDIRGDRLIDGDVLKTLLRLLDEQDSKALLGETFGGHTPSLELRTRTLRKQLVELAGQQRTSMFEARYQALERNEDPLADRLSQHDPQLPASVTRELLDTASGSELLQISEGQLPARQQQLMHLADQEVRLTRAYEGLELASVSNPDSDTLALHSLKNLPGWTGNVRFEIRDGDVDGPLLDSTGASEAPIQKVLVRRADDTWQPFDERGQELHSAGDFYSSVLRALPDAERDSLNIHIGEGEQLKKAIREQPVQRSELRLAMSAAPLDPTVDTLRLVGNARYRPAGRPTHEPDAPGFFEDPAIPQHPPVTGVVDVFQPLDPVQDITLEDRVREVYPAYTAAEARGLIDRLRAHPDGLENGLLRLTNEYVGLVDDLRRWTNDIPHVDPANGVALTPIQQRAAWRDRRILKDEIIKCWRRETGGASGYLLHIPEGVIGDLPTMRASFAHVSGLSIHGSASTRAIEPFLQRFTGLLLLEVKNVPLSNLPSSIDSMPLLRQLIVRDCGLTLSAANQQTLASLPDLAWLDLQDNPLSSPPNILAMPALRRLNLANTGISTLPAGLVVHPELVIGRFDGNRITELPDALFSALTSISDGFDFSNNPLSASAREKVKAHYSRTRKHFGILADPADIQRTIALFPDLDAVQATDLLYRVPGTLEHSRLQLAKWEADAVQLNTRMAQWANEIPEHHPTTGLPLDNQERLYERESRADFRRKLEAAWRSRKSEQFVASTGFIGEVPDPGVDFSHIVSLNLTGNTALSAVDPLLQRFPALRRLDLRDFALRDLPEQLTHMPELRTLVLDDCGVVMTPENHAVLGALTHLQTLELIDNPLGVAPDVSTLPQLTYLDLSNSGLTSVPVGLAEHPKLTTAILTGNQITELPDALFNLPGGRTAGFDLNDNPLSSATREQIKNYFREQRQDFSVQADKADVERAKALFPALDWQDASDVIYDLPGTLPDARAQLQRWETEFAQLSETLTRWQTQIPDLHPDTGRPFTAEQASTEQTARAAFKQKLERFWRARPGISRLRDQHFAADLSFTGDIPMLAADFKHVSSLTLNGNAGISATGPFLDLFPTVRSLEMRNFNLDQVPQAVLRMPSLGRLALNNCRITLTAQGQATLSSLTGLHSLNLSDNPLGIAPDLTAMPDLNDVRLSNTGITEVPVGLTGHPHLRTALLNGNLISELPANFFELDPDFAEGVNLANNPLSEISRDRIKTYYASYNRDFAVLAEPADMARALLLFPGLGNEQASRLIYKLPGTLENGRTQLTLWEAEITQLGADLTAWANDGPTYHPSTGAALSVVEQIAENVARVDFSEQLQAFWRKRLDNEPEIRADKFMSNLGFTGDLPALTADFSHVSALGLQGNESLNISSGFLTRFTGLEHLELRHFSLGRVPEAITAMPSLKRLTLSNSGVVLDAQGQAALSSLTRLEALDLFSNRLDQSPDVAALPSLVFIDLSSTGLDQVPAGLASHPRLEFALLSHNRITELPSEIFSMHAEDSAGFDFGVNPLSEATREQVKDYYQRTGEDLGVLAEQNDIDELKTLYPDCSNEEASEFIYQLPGTLVDGRTEVARRQVELATLKADLEAWAADIPAHSSTGEPLSGQRLLEELQKRNVFKDSLEQCWRRMSTDGLSSRQRFEFNLSMAGELPTLTAEFGHVQELNLVSTESIAPRLGRFLERFPNLQNLSVQGYQVADLPEAITAMRDLTSLSLVDCQITLTPLAIDAMAALDQLKVLDLRNNPLGQIPALSPLRELTTLNVSNAGLTEVPQGLFSHGRLRKADLSGNSIIELPEALLTANPTNTAELDFSGNPLSPPSQLNLVIYNARRQSLLASEERLM
ncbi:dermonecrotic toxin domain-containing protein [Pseudomonas sp. Ant30-3]|uniref:dermonecrotic toxin domain-containing protein n=1 Tax=Pseudomonas sp. Ant30-3 TaxID=1488328 RepID=UPI00067DE01E|nr:DUF6543 domain-containing protein [Pseudomonas sp. Ant30-3]